MKRLAITLVLALSAGAQGFKIPLNVEKLAAKAENVVEVTLDAKMLSLASGFLSDRDADEAKAKKLISGLRGLYVRSFEFASSGQYNEADVEALRSQLRGPQWSRIAGVRSRKAGENADVFFRSDKDQIGGLAVIAAEPRSLTVVYIDGPIDPAQLSELGGHFGIPKVEGKPRKEAK